MSPHGNRGTLLRGRERGRILKDGRIRSREVVGRAPHTEARGDWSSGRESQQEEVKMRFFTKENQITLSYTFNMLKVFKRRK